MDSDGFTIVKSKGSKKRPKEKRTTIIATDENIQIDKKTVISRVAAAVKDLETSEYFQIVLEKLKKSGKFSNIYCFGLGHFGDSVTAKYQFALLLCIKDSLKVDQSKVFLSDPAFYKDEVDLLKDEYNLNVITENIECHLPCETPSLVILPHCPKQMTNNLLYSNWKPELLENLCIIGNSITNIVNNINSNKLSFVNAVVDHNLLEESSLRNCFKYQDIFNDLSLHTFKVPDNQDSSVWSLTKPVYSQTDLEFITKKI